MGLPLVTDTYHADRGYRPPSSDPVFTFSPKVDLADAHAFAGEQPFEEFARMRAHAPVLWHSMEEKKLEGFWSLTRYDDIKAVSLDPNWSSQHGGIMMAYPNDERQHPQLHSASLNTMICLDAPHHMQLRREHMQFVRPTYVRELKAKVDAKVTDLLDDVEAAGPVLNWVEHFSSQLPLFTLCEMLGVPEADRPQIRQWMDMLEMTQVMMQEEVDLGNVDPAMLMHFLSQVQAMFDYGREALLERRKTPTGDLLSAIANLEVDGAKLPDEYLDGGWLLIIIAGNDTTRNSLSGALRLLTRFPEQKAKVIADPDLIPNMVHEIVRMVSPVMYMRRTAKADTELRGQKIAAGEKAVLWYGAGNRDPEVFADPDQFDVERANAKDHIGFGFGSHVCMGQRIANMQIEAAYRQILKRFPDITWTGKQHIHPNNFTHSIAELEVDLRGRA